VSFYQYTPFPSTRNSSFLATVGMTVVAVITTSFSLLAQAPSNQDHVTTTQGTNVVVSPSPPPIVPPQPVSASTSADAEIHKNIEYARVGDASLLLDLYLPKNGAKPVPLVIWIHGGGWREGSKDRAGLSGVVKAGMALASINYRLSQQAIFPAQLDDCKAAVRWLRAHAAEYHINADKIAVAGESAGAHLAALLGTTGGDASTEGDEGNAGVSSAVCAVVDFYGPTDLVAADFVDDMTDPKMAMTRMLLTSALLGGDPSTKGDLAKLASPIYHITAKTCPFFIAHGDHDTLVPMTQSTSFDAALKKAGVESDLIIVPGKNHGFHDYKVSQEAIAFLQQKLGA
jgi:acetyl esterase/lipase